MVKKRMIYLLSLNRDIKISRLVPIGHSLQLSTFTLGVRQSMHRNGVDINPIKVSNFPENSGR